MLNRFVGERAKLVMKGKREREREIEQDRESERLDRNLAIVSNAMTQRGV